jgi:hypothetical protein
VVLVWVQWQWHDGRLRAIPNNHGIYRITYRDAPAAHFIVAYSTYYCRVKMLCLLIAHGIFLRQEASQFRRAIMKRVPDLQDPLGARSIRSQSGTRLSPAHTRVCEAFAH